MHAPWIHTAPHCSRMSFCKACWLFFFQFNIYNSALYFYWQVCSILASSTLLLMTPPPPLLRSFPACFSCSFLSLIGWFSSERMFNTCVVFSLRMWRCSQSVSLWVASGLTCVTSSFVGRSPPTLSCEMKTSQCDEKKNNKFSLFFSSATVVNPDLLKCHVSFWFLLLIWSQAGVRSGR